MTAPPINGGFPAAQMYEVLEQACAHTGLRTAGAKVLRGHTNAVVRLRTEPVVVKIARKGTPVAEVERTVAFVHWLMQQGFATVPLHPVTQPQVVAGHPVTFWTYLPQHGVPVRASDLARPLRDLHALVEPPVRLPNLDNVRAIRKSLSAVTTLSDDDVAFMHVRVDALEQELEQISFALPPCAIQGDPQHRNALRDGTKTVLCDWDTVAHGQPEWDLVTMEIHCRRFGYGREHHRQFTLTYGFDVSQWSGYPILRELRELRMITTNARKASTLTTIEEVRRRIAGHRAGDVALQWNIL